MKMGERHSRPAAEGVDHAPQERALVLFSGGQEFATCLAWALDRLAHVEMIGFDYGQRHRVELDVRPVVLDAPRVAVPDCRDDTTRALQVALINRDTHSCYRGERTVLHDWEYGCGDCPACDLSEAR